MVDPPHEAAIVHVPAESTVYWSENAPVESEVTVCVPLAPPGLV